MTSLFLGIMLWAGLRLLREGKHVVNVTLALVFCHRAVSHHEEGAEAQEESSDLAEPRKQRGEWRVLRWLESAEWDVGKVQASQRNRYEAPHVIGGGWAAHTQGKIISVGCQSPEARISDLWEAWSQCQERQGLSTTMLSQGCSSQNSLGEDGSIPGL